MMQVTVLLSAVPDFHTHGVHEDRLGLSKEALDSWHTVALMVVHRYQLYPTTLYFLDEQILLSNVAILQKLSIILSIVAYSKGFQSFRQIAS